MEMLKINTNRITGKAKGLFSLLAVFLLIFSVSAKSVSSTLSLEKEKHLTFLQKEKSESKVNRINSVSIEDQEDFSEVDLDDLEFFTFDTFSFANIYSIVEKVEVFEVFQSIAITKHPLYALFCKWKIHLS